MLSVLWLLRWYPRGLSFLYEAATGEVNGREKDGPVVATSLGVGARGAVALHIKGSKLTFSVRSQGGPWQRQSGSWQLPTMFHIAVVVGAANGSCVLYTRAR
jgi:hypothetical protein